MELSIQKMKQNPAFSINGEIIRYFKMHPKAMRQVIADFLSKKYGFKIKRSTVGTSLLKRDELKTATPTSDAKRIRQSAYPQLNQALNIQIMDLNSTNISVSGDMIQEEAKRFTGRLSAPSDFNSQWAGLLD